MLISLDPGSTPIDVAISLTSFDSFILSDVSSQVFKIFPLRGKIAWQDLSLACLADPPAESPSTRNNSVTFISLRVQSESLLGSNIDLLLFFLESIFDDAYLF